MAEDALEGTASPREEEEGSYSNFKHDEVIVLNDILINGKVATEDIVGGEKEMREMKEMEERRRRRGGGGGGS